MNNLYLEYEVEDDYNKYEVKSYKGGLVILNDKFKSKLCTNIFMCEFQMIYSHLIYHHINNTLDLKFKYKNIKYLYNLYYMTYHCRLDDIIKTILRKWLMFFSTVFGGNVINQY